MAEQGHKGNIIIKRVKKVEGGAHGGSWKVAYADFVTAMMAFFLLMWLLNMVPTQKKAELATYFKEFSIFSHPAPSAMPLETGGLGPPGVVAGPQAERPDVSAVQGEESVAVPPGQEYLAQAKALEGQLERQMEKNLPELQGQVKVTEEQGRVRIEIMDKAERPLFERGSAALLPDAQKILAALTDVIKKEGVKVAIEGHTDAYKYAGPYTNWDLSTERALSARRLMVADGLDPAKVVQVTGFAETRPYVADNPFDPKNRRISLLLYREPKPGEVPAKAAAPGAKPEAAKPEAAKPATPPAPPPNVGDVIEKQIENLYEKSTEGQF